eukprot:Ihof_evm11s36 gene=Ihof_evmTU11s36
MDNDTPRGYVDGVQERRSRSRSPPRHRDSLEMRSEDHTPRVGRSPVARVERNAFSLYVSGLASRTRESDLIAKFEPYGKVKGAVIIKDPHTQLSRGFGFVNLQNDAECEEAISHINRTEMDGHTIMVERAKRQKAHSPTPGRYFGTKSYDTTGSTRGRPADRFSDRFRERISGERERERYYGGYDRSREIDMYRRPAYDGYESRLPPPRSSTYDRRYNDRSYDYRPVPSSTYGERERERYSDYPPIRQYPDERDYRRVDYYESAASRPILS